MSRNRIQYSRAFSGTWHYLDSPVGDITGHWFTDGYDQCYDEPGPGDNAPFSVESLRYSGGRIFSNSTNSNYFNDRACGWIRSNNAAAKTHVFNSYPPDGDLAVQLMKRTNPSRPYVDWVANLAQMKLMPKLLKDEVGELLSLKHNARDFLNYEFNIRPTLDDLRKLFDFQNQTERRIRELTRMRDKGIKRTISLFERGGEELIHGVVFESLGVLASGSLRKSTNMIIKGHARWNPEFGLQPSDQQIMLQARSAVLGVTADLSTLWQALPWSWLIDWFTNVGDYLAANRNICNATCSGLRLMHHGLTRTQSTNDLFVSPGYTMTPVQATYETKDRVIATPTLEAQFPILSGEQLGILGSIGVLSRH